MTHSVNISDDLIRDAQNSCESTTCTPDATIERWARLGRELDVFLHRTADATRSKSAEIVDQHGQ